MLGMYHAKYADRKLPRVDLAKSNLDGKNAVIFPL